MGAGQNSPEVRSFAFVTARLHFALGGTERMTRPEKENLMRLGFGMGLNLCLWPQVRGLAAWSSYDREARIALIGGSLAVAAVVAVVPLFWRGKPWQAPLAFILLWLPAASLYVSVCTAFHLR
jgi:hypothetical protein